MSEKKLNENWREDLEKHKERWAKYAQDLLWLLEKMGIDDPEALRLKSRLEDAVFEKRALEQRSEDLDDEMCRARTELMNMIDPEAEDPWRDAMDQAQQKIDDDLYNLNE